MGLNPSLCFYRRMVKSLKGKFRGDNKTYKQFKSSFKASIIANKHETNPVEIAKMIFEFDIAREWLITEVVRAELKEDGQYKLKILKEQLQSVNLKPVDHPEYFEFNIPQALINNKH